MYNRGYYIDGDDDNDGDDGVCQGRTVWERDQRCRRRSFMPVSFLEDDTVDFPDELDTSFFARDGLRREDEELSTYADDVFDSPSEAAIKEEGSNTAADESDLTGGALDKSELERSHLMM
uniref:Inactive rhomboid protein n=1 Tax=Hucho hucho TaxID=62062 RepID=A0A4W5MGB6_9TELE